MKTTTDSMKKHGERCPIRLRRFVRTAFIAGFTAMVAMTFPASADEPEGALATRESDVGIEARKAGNLDAALPHFEAAFRAQPSSMNAAKLAQTEFDLGRYREAAEHFRFYLQQKEPKPEDRARVEELLIRAKSRIGLLDVRVDTPGAEILVDRAVVGVAPLSQEIFAEPGNRVVEGRKLGCIFEPVSVKFEPGRKQSLSFNCKRPSPRLPPPVARTPTWKKVVIPVTAVAGAVGLGVGIGFRARANALSEEVDKDLAALAKATPSSMPVCDVGLPEENRVLCEDIRSKDRDAVTANNVWAPVLIVGGVSATAAILMALWPTPASKTVRVVPVVGASERGVGIIVSF